MTKTHWRKAFNSDYLSSADVDGQDLILTIKKVVLEEVKAAKGTSNTCNVAYFNESVKPMVLNVGNSKTVKGFANSKYLEDWVGVSIQVYVQDGVRFGSELTEGLRIRPVQPNKSKSKQENKLPELTPQHKKWTGAKKAIKEGSQNIESLKAYFTISKENEKLLLNEKV